MAGSEVRGLRRERAGGGLAITLDPPDRLNALRWEMVRGLTEWVAAAGTDPDVRAVVVTGAGRAFCSGDDIVGGMDDAGTDMKAMRRRILDATTRGPHHSLVTAFLSAPKPIIAALNGRC